MRCVSPKRGWCSNRIPCIWGERVSTPKRAASPEMAARPVPMLEGRSSIGRLGLFVHITAGFGDVGFCGYWTLEIFCVQPIRIFAGVEICQIFFHSIEGEFENYRSGKYQNNTGIQHSMLYREFEPK